MIYLIAGIIANVFIFLAFRTFSIFKIDNLQAIVVNYIVCVIASIVFSGDPQLLLSVDLFSPWALAAVVLGLLLVIGFYVATITAQGMGVSITSVASKMSMVFPIAFSLFFMKIEGIQFSVFNYMGMLLAVLSIYLGSLRKGSDQRIILSKKNMLVFPFAVFLVGGLIDITISYSNNYLINITNQGAFPLVLFASATVIGSLFMAFQKKKLEARSLIGGLYLGISNYFSLYFVLKALTFFQNNGAVFYPVYNVGIILLSSVLAMIFFKERLSRINYLGLILSILALFLLSHQEIIDYF